MKNTENMKIHSRPIHLGVILNHKGSSPKSSINMVKKKRASINLNSVKEFIKRILSYKSAYIILPAFLLSLFWFSWVVWNKVLPHKTPGVHYHAGFVVFQNNKKVDLSDNQYMYFSACSVNNKQDASVINGQIEKAHLHENIGDLVHVEAKGAIWKDLFTNIGFTLDETSSVGYINGREEPNFLTRPIRPYESLVVFIGDNNRELLNQAVTKDYILDMAKNSTLCG